jgi:hypothetical protein
MKRGRNKGIRMKSTKGLDELIVLIRGAGEVASGVGHRLRHRRNGRLVEHVVHVPAGPGYRRQVQQVGLVEVHAPQLGDVLPLSGGEVVQTPHALAPLQQGPRQGRSDEAGSAGDQVRGHSLKQ